MKFWHAYHIIYFYQFSISNSYIYTHLGQLGVDYLCILLNIITLTELSTKN